MTSTKAQLGFTLIELMIAMAIGAFLLSGVGLAYSSISQTASHSKNIEQNLEVIRFSSQFFTATLKQTTDMPTISGTDSDILTVKHVGGTQSCAGIDETNDYQEEYTVADGFLVCTVSGNTVKLLKGVDAIEFSLNNSLAHIQLTATSLPDYLNDEIDIYVALTGIILAQEFQ